MAAPIEMFDKLCGLVAAATPSTIAEGLPLVFTPGNLARDTMARRIGAFMEWRKRGGFELVRLQAQNAHQLDAQIRFPISQDNWRLRIILDQEGSGLIDEMLMGRAALPKLATGRPDQQIADAFLSYVAHLGQHDLFSGAVLIGRHGKILGQQAVGYASREYKVLNTPATLFNVASLTKSWTAMAVAKLVEQDRLSLNTPVSQLTRIGGQPLDKRIEIRHLLSHTSGLGDYFGAGFDQTPRDQIRTLDDFLNMATSLKPAFEPGTDWAYSNIGLLLLGKVIERLCGQPYYDAIRSVVFEPAGMKTAFFPHLDEVQSGCASGYGNRWTDEGPVVINALHSWAVRGGPDGCAFASLADIWAFVGALKNGKLISAKMANEMCSAKPELGSHDYGYGFSVMPDGAVVGHSGGLIGASANLDMMNDPDGWTVIVLANDLSMRTPVIKARQLIGVTTQERDDAQTNMPRAGLTAR